MSRLGPEGLLFSRFKALFNKERSGSNLDLADSAKVWLTRAKKILLWLSINFSKKDEMKMKWTRNFIWVFEVDSFFNEFFNKLVIFGHKLTLNKKKKCILEKKTIQGILGIYLGSTMGNICRRHKRKKLLEKAFCWWLRNFAEWFHC